MLQKVSHAATDAATGEHLFLQTPVQKKKGSNNRFPLKGKNLALEAKDKVLKYTQTVDRTQNNPVPCAKYGMQLPLTQPCSRADKLSEATHAFAELKGPKDTLEQTLFFQGQLDDNDLDFLQTDATNRYFGMVSSVCFFHCFFIRHIIPYNHNF